MRTRRERHVTTRSMAAAVLLSLLAAGPATKPATQPAGNAGPGPRRGEINRAPLPPVGRVRQLEEAEHQEAVNLRDAADLARADFEKRYRSHPRPFPPQADAEFEDVVAAFREVSARFPGTEADCYCRIRLSGAYLYRGKREEALDEAKRAAETFAGTRPGLDADLTVARLYLNPIRDPNRAATWLLRARQGLPLIEDPSERQKTDLAFDQALSELDKLKREQLEKK
jgi:hypothetical protein